MDASQVLAQMNEKWNELISNYYDHICENYLKHIAQEYDMEYEELLLKSKELKDEILQTSTNNINKSKCDIKKKMPSKASIKAAEKAAAKEAMEKTKYSDYCRSDLIAKCKEYSIPVKRKNQDMIDLLLERENEEE